MSDTHDTMPAPPAFDEVDLTPLEAASNVIKDVAQRLGILPEILATVNASARDMRIVSEQMRTLGTAFENLSREIRHLNDRVNALDDRTEERLRALESRVTTLEIKASVVVDRG